jgi:hypothetical protein
MCLRIEQSTITEHDSHIAVRAAKGQAWVTRPIQQSHGCAIGPSERKLQIADAAVADIHEHLEVRYQSIRADLNR